MTATVSILHYSKPDLGVSLEELSIHPSEQSRGFDGSRGKHFFTRRNQRWRQGEAFVSIGLHVEFDPSFEKMAFMSPGLRLMDNTTHKHS